MDGMGAKLIRGMMKRRKVDRIENLIKLAHFRKP